MLASEMYEFRNLLAEKGILFCYSGYLTEDVLSGIGQAIRMKLQLEEADKTVARSVFSLFVEQVQNVIRYSAEKEEFMSGDSKRELRFGVLTVGCKDDVFFVSCSNLIEEKDVARLGKNLTHIQQLDSDELKQLYKDTLKGETPEGSKGAGVGFIDIARRAKKGFEFDFIPVEEKRSYFSIKAYV
ncbi:SiaB family protein kinase [Terasakiella sp. A23]|uniref:SiaB family protein kinase n=1 Tax=Terasakiella sp. FCG-A23 TaxID=3080561 RepID=UPI0029544426|nr:SiaB family protein kinase [Terasakiella sp. A23]MDV7339618.1 SiaB family protein kinase [Terasakiella sp. A23]